MNLILLPTDIFKLVTLLGAMGFQYGGQDKEIDTDNLFGDRECYRGWMIEQFPGLKLYHLESGHWWFAENDEFPVEAVKRILGAT